MYAQNNIVASLFQHADVAQPLLNNELENVCRTFNVFFACDDHIFKIRDRFTRFSGSKNLVEDAAAVCFLPARAVVMA